MGILQAIKLALASIRSNKLRSFLTMLGIIIGVAAVIVLVAIGQGTTAQVTGQIQGMGSNLITISIRSNQTDFTLTYDEVMGWKSRSGIQGIAPVVTGNVNVKYGNKKYDTSLEGVNSEYQQVRAYQVQEGRFILDGDLTYRQKVVLLGTDVWKELFGSANPVGETIKINGENFKVIGLLASKGTASMGSNDDKVLIPITTAQRLLDTRGIRSAYIQASASDQVDSVVAQLEGILLRKLKDSDKFRVFNQAEMLSTISQVTGTLTAMLGGIAAISLVVG
ncbi:MAG TPA: ABC transporter permease, partial [Bacillota bacterium]|nr:ABC transporter permease [Bacillota bacterium]